MAKKFKLALHFKGEDIYTELFYKDGVDENLHESFWEVYRDHRKERGLLTWGDEGFDGTLPVKEDSPSYYLELFSLYQDDKNYSELMSMEIAVGASVPDDVYEDVLRCIGEWEDRVKVRALKDLYDSLSGCIEASDNESMEQRIESDKHGRRVLERVKEELKEVGVEMREEEWGEVE